MSAVYLYPIRVAFILFPLLAALLTLPVLIYQYQKYNYVNKMRLFVTYLFILYLLCAYFQTILPLPENRDIISQLGTNRPYYNLELFSSVRTFLDQTSVIPRQISSYRHLIHEPAFLQIGFNILLTIPFGVFLRYLLNQRFFPTLFFSFLLSAFFEFSQLTGIFGIYNAPYRLFELDDFIWNTLGGGIGYLIAPLFTVWIPSLQAIDYRHRHDDRVGLIRRGIAFLLDWFVIDLSSQVLHQAYPIIPRDLIFFLVFLVMTAFLPLIWKGKTLGKFLVRIQLVSHEQSQAFSALLLRSLSLYLMCFGLDVCYDFLANWLGQSGRTLVLLSLFYGSTKIYVLLDSFFHLKSGHFLHQRLSGLQNQPIQ